ncbi:MAG: gamma carbonic anhydrase family protein [Candidatus Ranarchaeia archaeon]|jgi:carbonic anhydrase/acetyltransferase-like protein (isoleucine patch superfamily)
MGIYAFQNKKPKIAETASISPDAVLIGDITIGEQSSIWSGVVIRAMDSSISIGECTNIQENSVITTIGKQKTTIGDNVTVFPGVTITSARIANDVSIGTRSTLLPNSVIPQTSEVGPMTLITQRLQIPPGSYVVGVPGRVLRKLPSTKLEQNRSYAKSMSKTAAKLFSLSK